MLLMGLRLGEGVDLDRLSRVSGVGRRRAAVAALTQQGLIEAIPGGERASAPRGKGRFILNEIVLRLAMSFTRDGAADHTAHRRRFHLPPAAE